ncbi:DNA polymerase III subunit alpha [Deferribacter thermophilus]|uniref:DNA polymerase III subunit alpha n=1 Tax=Deferribacter thermophilus TaxID=53573 RepID=UPI003C2567F0
MKKDFVHLHLHTQYSLLDGAIHISDLMQKLKENGSKAVAITDHGTMYGIVDFYNQAFNHGIKPIIGCEVYVAPDSRFNKNYDKKEDKNYHLVLLAQTNTGLKNLQYLVSKAHLEGFYYKPRIDKELLAEHSKGLIALSACLAGEPARKILTENYESAKKAALEYAEIMGKDNYFLEIQDNGIEEQKLVNKKLIEISKETGIPLVATNDCHFLNREDYSSHQVLMCIQYQQTLNDPNRRDSHSSELYVKSPEEMWKSFNEVEEALINTVKIAERCNVSMTFGELHLPVYDVPEGYTLKTYLEHIAKEGLHKRLAKVPLELHSKYYERLEYELKIIHEKGYDGYYLIVWDFINFAKKNKIPVGPGRGSGAGSLVAYAVGITDIDPIKYNLLFERFLNPERKSMPDFDIDFCMNRREEVIDYVRNKYGHDRVAQIITFGKLLARGVIRDVGRALEIPLKTVDKIAKMIPEKPGLTLKKALEMDPELKPNIESIEKGKELLDHALKLEGLLRNAGMHAAGVVIADKPLVEYVPLCKGQNDEVVTQFEKDTLEKVGLVKFDFLGLKNLTVIDYASKLIRETKDPDFDISSIPLDDKKTFELLSSGETTGVFQLESSGMKNLLKKLKPTTFEDIIALVALYRPGPIGSGMLDDFVKRKHGLQEITYPLPELEEILKETYGIIVYQEQVMQIAQVIAGYSLGSADLLRRAMGKKKPEEMAKHREIFLYGDEKLGIEGAVKRGFDEKIASEIFDLMAKFAEYGFNKSHSAAYAMVSYQTAYLKAHYPVEYMAALLSNELEKGDKVVGFIDECKKMGIKVLKPDINESYKDFVISGDSIRFGLGAIKNVGFGAIDEIINEREKNGKFKSIYDLCKRVDLRTVNRKVLESLIKAGALDSFGKNRRQLLQVLDEAMERAQKEQQLKNVGVITIEDLLKENGITETDDEFYPDVEEMPENELLKFEKEVLGFYLTNHPLVNYSNILDIFTKRSSDIEPIDENNSVMVGGIVKDVKNYITKTNERMAFVTLEDLDGTMDVVVFPKLYKENVRHFVEDAIIIVKGVVNYKDDTYSIVADEIYGIEEAFIKLIDGIKLKITATGFNKNLCEEIKSVVYREKGDKKLIFEVYVPAKGKVIMEADEDFKVSPTLAFFKQIDNILGENRYEVIIHNGS